ncbi:MAG: hypothetical protein ACOZQL_28225 [Myxococcota bacterium]
MRWLVWAMVLVGGSGCAASRFGAATSMAMERFPKKAQLEQVVLRAPKLDVARLDASSASSWTLEGPFPTEAKLVPHAPTTAWERALVEVAPQVGKALSEDLQCFAREYARFLLAQGKPGNSLQAFIERRCGVLAPHVQAATLSGSVPDGVTEAEWVTQWKAGLPKLLGGTAPELAGIAVRRADDGRAVLVIAMAKLEARLLQPVPLVGSTGKLVLRGALTGRKAERVEALINKGALDAVACKPLDVVRPPEFAFECPVEVADPRTTVAIAAFESGRLLGEDVGTFLLWPAGTPNDTWTRPGAAAEVSDDDFSAAFLAAVNQMRANARLPLLAEAKAQSATATGLAPHYFAALLGQADPADADEIALGMLAGWDVGVDIVSSGFGSQWISGSRDLGVLLELLLDNPFSRKSLTDPRATLLAAGHVKGSGTSLATLFATYVPLGTFDRKESEVAIITRLNQLRVDRKLGLAQWTLWPQDEGALVARQLEERRWTPDQALQHVLEKTAQVAAGGTVSGYVQLVDDLEHFQFPPEVLMRPDIRVFLAVGAYRAEDWAQSRYVVCFVIAQAGDVQTASR